MAVIIFDITDDAFDARVQRTGTSYPPSGSYLVNSTEATMYVEKWYSNPDYIISVGLLRFDTSSLPNDCVILSASLVLYIVSKADNDSRSFVAEWYDMGASAGSEDWTSTVASNAHSGTSISSITASSANSFSLSNLSNISKTGYTGLRLHVTGDTPVNGSSVSWASYSYKQYVANQAEPRLLITADLPSGSAYARIGNQNYV